MELHLTISENPASKMGHWLKLPLTEVLPTDCSLTAWLLTDCGDYFSGIAEQVEPSRIPALNRLALLLQTLSEEEEEKLDAMMECEYNKSIGTVERLIVQLPCAELLSGIETNEDLGRYYMEQTVHIFLPEPIAQHFDYAGYGKTIRKLSAGIFTSKGFLMLKL